MGTLGERLRVARRRLGMSQGELGAAVGIGQPAISRLEYGGGLPPPDTLARLAAALGVELGWLLGEAERTAQHGAAGIEGSVPAATVAPDAPGAMTRLQALAEYRELLERWRL